MKKTTISIEELREAFRGATRKEREKPPKWKIIHCERCGCEVSCMSRRKKYCDTCRQIVIKEQTAARRELYIEAQKKAKKTKREPKITENAAAARAAGMSYGKYKAMMALKGAWT